jgi:septal ring-binding cell division protein DamX
MLNRLRFSIPCLSLSLLIVAGCTPSTPTPAPTAAAPTAKASVPATTPATTAPTTTPVTSAPATTPTAAAAPKTDDSKKPKNAYDEKFVSSYMEGCVKASAGNPGNEAYCKCTINKIQDKYTLEEFIKITQSMKPGQEPPAEMVDVIKSCLPPQ